MKAGLKGVIFLGTLYLAFKLFTPNLYVKPPDIATESRILGLSKELLAFKTRCGFLPWADREDGSEKQGCEMALYKPKKTFKNDDGVQVFVFADDGWQNDLMYLPYSDHFEFISYGADGMPGGKRDFFYDSRTGEMTYSN